MREQVGISGRLVTLKKFLTNNGLHKEAYGLGQTIMASESDSEKTVDLRAGRRTGIEPSFSTTREDLPSGPAYATDNRPSRKKRKAETSSLDETIALGPNSREWTSKSEPHVLAAGLTPIRFIAGTEAGERGQGAFSSEGNIYEVLYDGGTAVAKVLSGAYRPEPDVWRRIGSIRDKLPSEQARHLPDIYDIIETSPFETVIVMEKLDAPNWHIKDVLRTKKHRSLSEMMENSDFLSEALSAAFAKIADHEPDEEDSEEKEIFAMFEVEKDHLKSLIEGALFKRKISSDQISTRVQDFFSDYLNRFNLTHSKLPGIIADDIQKTFEKYLTASDKPIAKYFSPKGIDETLKHLSTSEELGPKEDKDRTDRMGLLTEERSSAVYSESPERFMYSERHMPETKSFFSMLNSLREFGIEWSDVHANNIMERTGTKELVLIDVGLFY